MTYRVIVLNLFFVLIVFPILVSAQAFDNPFSNGLNSIPNFIRVLTDDIIIPIGAVVVVIMIIYSGFLFVTAMGNETKITDAKKNFTYAVIGALILLGSWAIANVIKNVVCSLYTTPPSGLGCNS